MATSPAEAEMEKKLMRLKKDELKVEARKLSLDESGTKSDLVKRIVGSPGILDASTMAKENGIKVTNKRTRSRSQAAREKLKEERESIVLWKKPLTTLNYSFRELCITIFEWGQKCLESKKTLALASILIALGVVLYRVDGPHKVHFQSAEKYILWCLWWVGLGVLSSVGLGTGLHTFLLYLGPHIAAVTMAAYECGSTDFPSPPYPDSIICPEVGGNGNDQKTKMAAKAAISLWAIMSKVRVEAFCWGAGTALGELPPYFMARAHRLSGYDPDEDENEFEELQEKLANNEEMNWFDRAKLGIERLVERVGFFGILACASIPNPLFDLAGITCGHFLVPFWTFFGATLIGKAVVKMHIQKIFIIMAFNETLVATVVSNINRIPWLGPKIEAPFKEFLAKQKEKLHRKAGSPVESEPSTLGWIFEKLVLAMILYFVLSIINSLAQSYHKRLHKKKSSSKEH